MLKYENFAVGDYIRAYDFEPVENRPARYIEGFIVGRQTVHGARCYTVEVERDTLSNREAAYVNVPMETTFDYDGRVVYAVDPRYGH